MNFDKLTISFDELITEKLDSIVGGYFVQQANYGSIVPSREVTGGEK